MKIITNNPVLVAGGEMASGPNGEVTGVLAPVPPSLTNPASATIVNAPAGTEPSKFQKGLGTVDKIITTGQETGAFQTIGNLWNKVRGKKKGEQTAPVAPVVTQETKKEDNTMKYVLIGGGVLALGLVVYFATKKK